jgi:hypothetical protein
VDVAGLVLAVALVIGLSFTLLLNRELIQGYRESDSQRRRLILTRVLPIALGISALMLGGAIAGAMIGHGAFVGAIVTAAAMMGVSVVAMLVVLAVAVVRGVREER